MATAAAKGIGKGIIKGVAVCLLVVIAYVLLQLYLEQNSPQGRAASEDGSVIHVAELMVKTRLRDPESAQFLGSRVVRKDGKEAVCGFVNAKNGFGGMAGEKWFVVVGADVYFASDGPAAFDKIDGLCGDNR